MMSIPVRAAQVAAALESMTTTQSAPSTQALADKFQALMQRPTMAPPSEPQSDGATVAAKLIEFSDAEMQRTVDHVLTFGHNARYMSAPEMAAASMRVMCELMGTQLDEAAKLSVTHVMKSSLDTLMKNQ
jgi:type III secretion inner rod protein HrpB2